MTYTRPALEDSVGVVVGGDEDDELVGPIIIGVIKIVSVTFHINNLPYIIFELFMVMSDYELLYHDIVV